MSKHTPGPWFVRNLDHEYRKAIYGYNDDKYICPVARIEYCGHDNCDEELANAHLIAAAPKMLKALKIVETFTASDGLMNEANSLVLPAVRDAIASATAKGE